MQEIGPCWIGNAPILMGIDSGLKFSTVFYCIQSGRWFDGTTPPCFRVWGPFSAWNFLKPQEFPFLPETSLRPQYEDGSESKVNWWIRIPGGKRTWPRGWTRSKCGAAQVRSLSAGNKVEETLGGLRLPVSNGFQLLIVVRPWVVVVVVVVVDVVVSKQKSGLWEIWGEVFVWHFLMSIVMLYVSNVLPSLPSKKEIPGHPTWI